MARRFGYSRVSKGFVGALASNATAAVGRPLIGMSGTGFMSRRWSCRYSQARTAMGMSVHLQGSGSRLPVAVVCLGAVALLYAGSFYTRDWRPVVHQAGRPLTETVSARSTVAVARPMTLDAKPAEVPARIAERTTRAEPEVTGAVPRSPEPVAS